MLEESPYNNSIDVRTSAFGEVELRCMWDVLEKSCWEMLGGKKSYMVQRFKVENDAKPSVVFRKLTHFSCLTSV